MNFAKKLEALVKAAMPTAKVISLGDEIYAAVCPECSNKISVI